MIADMKNTFRFALLLMLLPAAFSCKKFLDKQPVTEKGPDFIFSNSETVFHAIAGVYAQLTGDQGYGKVLSLYFPVDNDETQGPTGALDNARREISRYTLTAANAEIQRPFEQMFRGIEYANICIANIPQMEAFSNGSTQEKGRLRRMYGEALTLRAQFYFEAIRNYGDLPYHFEPASVQAVKDPFPARVDRDSIYNRIIEDLRIAQEYVPWVNELSAIGDVPDERITRGTLKALRARIALFCGGYSLRQQSAQMERRADYLRFYEIARTECAEVMASGVHSLNASFKDLWKNQVCGRAITDPNNELMFQVGAIGTNATGDTKLGYYNGPTVNSLGNRSINILPTYFYAFDSMDLRRDVTCAPYTVGANGSTKAATGTTAIVDGKYRRDWISNPVVSPSDAAQYFSLKWQILRYSDVLLMFAEAENEINGPTTAAYDAVNQVRRRGFGLPISAVSEADLPAGLSKSQFFSAVVRERSFELGGEGVRKYDLIRWNLLKTRIEQTRFLLDELQQRIGLYENFPTSMYYWTGTTADDKAMWATSLYNPTPSTANAPAGATRVAWIGSSIGTTILGRYAIGFTPNKSELLPIPQATRGANPNLTQNPNY